jgi:hypothetical protein
MKYTDTISGEELYIDVDRYGTKYYFKNKKKTILHRIDGPAFESADGTKGWYVDGERHRLDGPAIEHANGAKYWSVNGKLHRIDGPAVDWSNGDKHWYINGVCIFGVDRDNRLVNRMQ